jgi:hypothetical protein
LNIEEKSDEVIKEEPKEWKEDMSKNLSNVLKPAIPDFGYKECMNFSDEVEKQGSKWSLFLDVIRRYPIKTNVQNIVKTIRKEEASYYFKLYRKRRRSSLI